MRLKYSYLFSLFLFLTILCLVKYLFSIPSYILPGVSDIYKAAIHNYNVMLHAVKITFLQSVFGFLLATFIGTLTAILLAEFKFIRQIFLSWVICLQLIPIIVLAPIITLWLGHGIYAITCISFLICFFPIIINTLHGLLSTDIKLMKFFQSLHVSPLKTFWHLKLPHALPHFFQGLKIAATLAPIGAITGDIFVGGASGKLGGVGFLIITYYAQMRIPALFAITLLTCLIGLFFVSIIHLLQWYFLHKWHPLYVDSSSS